MHTSGHDSCTDHPLTNSQVGVASLGARLSCQASTAKVGSPGLSTARFRRLKGVPGDACRNARAYFVPNNRLYAIGCVWGCVLVMLWKAMAGFEGVLATRRLGYGSLWLPISALGLALTWQARICFHHSCESDLFQVRSRGRRGPCPPNLDRPATHTHTAPLRPLSPSVDFRHFVNSDKRSLRESSRSRSSPKSCSIGRLFGLVSFADSVTVQSPMVPHEHTMPTPLCLISSNCRSTSAGSTVFRSRDR